MDTDILVVGAGPAGATAARLLSLKGRRPLLIDADAAKADRLELLSPASLPLLAALDLHELLSDPAVARPCAGIRRRAYADAPVEFDDFLRRRGGRGFVVDRLRLDERLRTLAMRAGAVRRVGRVRRIERLNGRFEIVVERQGASERIRTSVVIDASGRPAAVARRLGARRLVSERLVAERCLLDPDGDTVHAPAWLDFDGCDDGWYYGVSGPDGRRERWKVCRQRAGVFDGPRINASSSRLSEAAGGGWIAIGDAAIAFDPIASQGLANALSTALVATGAILSSPGLVDEAISAYTEAIAATFANSELGRAEVYAALRSRMPTMKGS
ncbi:MAG: NAD(P)/FAD-dependent oxidoreductase [Reyranellaceae bacterium]